MSTFSKFISKHKDAVTMVVDESAAIVESGAVGAHTDQARKNWLLGSALLAMFEHFALSEKPATVKAPSKAKAAAADPVATGDATS